MDIIEKINRDIKEATRHNQKSVMFHYSVLVNASELSGIDPIDFCRDVGVPDSYGTEFRKMMNLAEFLKSNGLKIVPR
jgi:hypothetical protein